MVIVTTALNRGFGPVNRLCLETMAITGSGEGAPQVIGGLMNSYVGNDILMQAPCSTIIQHLRVNAGVSM